MIDTPTIGNKIVDKMNFSTCYHFSYMYVDLVKLTYLSPPPSNNVLSWTYIST